MTSAQMPVVTKANTKHTQVLGYALHVLSHVLRVIRLLTVPNVLLGSILLLISLCVGPAVIPVGAIMCILNRATVPAFAVIRLAVYPVLIICVMPVMPAFSC